MADSIIDLEMTRSDPKASPKMGFNHEHPCHLNADLSWIVLRCLTRSLAPAARIDGSCVGQFHFPDICEEGLETLQSLQIQIAVEGRTAGKCSHLLLRLSISGGRQLGSCPVR